MKIFRWVRVIWDIIFFIVGFGFGDRGGVSCCGNWEKFIRGEGVGVGGGEGFMGFGVGCWVGEVFSGYWLFSWLLVRFMVFCILVSICCFFCLGMCLKCIVVIG